MPHLDQELSSYIGTTLREELTLKDGAIRSSRLSLGRGLRDVGEAARAKDKQIVSDRSRRRGDGGGGGDTQEPIPATAHSPSARQGDFVAAVLRG